MNSHRLEYRNSLQCFLKYCIKFILVIGLNCASMYAMPSDTIRIGVDLNNPPFEYIDDNGEIKGFTVDLARKLLFHMGKTPLFYAGNRGQIFHWLEHGEVDMLCNVGYINAPTENWRYGPINCASPLVLVVPKESPVTESIPIDSLCVLVEKNGYTTHILNDLDVQCQKVHCNSVDEMLLQLLAGKGDGAYMSYYHFQAISGILGNTDAFRVVDYQHPLMSFHYAIHEDKVKLDQEMELAMLDMIEQDVYSKLHHQYFPNTIEAQVARLRYWLVISLIVVLLLFAAFFAYQYFVLTRLKTKELNLESYMFSVFNHLPFFVSLEKISEDAKAKSDRTAKNSGSNVLGYDAHLSIDHVHKDDYDTVVEARKDALYGEDVSLDFVRLQTTEDDEEHCVDYVIMPMTHLKQDYLLTVGHDMGSIFKLHQQAVEQVEERNLFLSNLSHELHTTLNAVLGFSELVGDGCTGEQLEEFKQIVRSKAKDFHLLVDDIMLLSKIELAGGSRKRSQNLAVVMKDLVQNEIISAPEYKDVDVHFEQLYTELHVCIDINIFLLPLRVMMQSVLSETESGPITTGLFANEHNVVMYVESNNMDNHYGNHSAIFNCFYSLDASDSRTGFGLAFVKALVLRLGGKLGVTLHKEGKQLFWMELPMDVDLSLNSAHSDIFEQRKEKLDSRYLGYWYEKDVDGIISEHKPQNNHK